MLPEEASVCACEDGAIAIYIYIYIMSNLALESTLDSASVRLKIYCFLLDLDLLKEAPKNIRYRFPNT